MSELVAFAEFALRVLGASVHLYVKGECRKGRKMGHITITANSDAELRARLCQLLQRLPGGDASIYTQFGALPQAAPGRRHHGIGVGPTRDVASCAPSRPLPGAIRPHDCIRASRAGQTCGVRAVII